MATIDKYEAAERFVEFLEKEVVNDATGQQLHEIEKDPSGLFWLGRLAPEKEISESPLGTELSALSLVQ